MDVTCKHPGQPDASARVISRANAGLAGNIIFGGVVGAVIDHSKGTAYTYPTWIQLIFGQSLVFDRYQEKEGAPTPALGSPRAQLGTGQAPVSAATRVDNSQLGGVNATSTACSQGAVACGR